MVKFQDLEWDVEFTNIRKLKTTRDLLSYSTGRVHPKETIIRKKKFDDIPEHQGGFQKTFDKSFWKMLGNPNGVLKDVKWHENCFGR